MEETPYKCSICGKFYSSDGSLRKHKSVIHGPNSKKQCTKCKKEFSANNYAIHVKLCSGIKYLRNVNEVELRPCSVSLERLPQRNLCESFKKSMNLKQCSELNKSPKKSVEFHAKPKESNAEFIRKSVRQKDTKTLQSMFVEIAEEDGLKVTVIPGKGRGILATKIFRKGDWVTEYIGDLLIGREAIARETEYAKNPNCGSFMFFFRMFDKPYCIDGTKKLKKKSRLINHSRKNPNVQPKVINFEGNPRLIFVAKRDVLPGEEILYDYGDRNPNNVQELPWLKE